jgi:hypothetical protein
MVGFAVFATANVIWNFGTCMQKRWLLFLRKRSMGLDRYLGRAGQGLRARFQAMLAIYVLAWRGARKGGLFQHGSGFMGCVVGKKLMYEKPHDA